MSVVALTREDCRIDAFSIIADTQPELFVGIANLNLNPVRLCVTKRISESFGGNPVYIIANEGMEIARSASGRVEDRS